MGSLIPLLGQADPVTVGNFLYRLKGPEFLALYSGWFLLVIVAVIVLRSTGFDKALTTLGGLVLFEGFGLARFIVGSRHGLHKWDLLMMMMLFGGVLFFIRAHHLENLNTGTCSGSSCSGSSCGGGGCGGGGGGCGGCGGS